MLRRVLVGFGVLAMLLTLAAGAMAAGPVVDVVLAIEYDSGVFAATVLAQGPAPLADAHLLVNGAAVVPDRENEIVLSSAKNRTLFKFAKFGSEVVVDPGDVVTAVVTDLSGATTEKSVTCVAGRIFRQLVICR